MNILDSYLFETMDDDLQARVKAYVVQIDYLKNNPHYTDLELVYKSEIRLMELMVEFVRSLNSRSKIIRNELKIAEWKLNSLRKQLSKFTKDATCIG